MGPLSFLEAGGVLHESNHWTIIREMDRRMERNSIEKQEVGKFSRILLSADEIWEG